MSLMVIQVKSNFMVVTMLSCCMCNFFRFITHSITCMNSKWTHFWDLGHGRKKIWISLSLVDSLAISYSSPSSPKTLCISKTTSAQRLLRAAQWSPLQGMPRNHLTPLAAIWWIFEQQIKWFIEKQWWCAPNKSILSSYEYDFNIYSFGSLI